MKQQLPAFVASMKDLVLEQQTEVEKAIIGGGNYKMQQAYQCLEVIDGIWWRMNEQQRRAHIKKLSACWRRMKQKLCPLLPSSTTN